ncbi:MAG: helix-turn-helix transcriptional regulator, partial [Actinomycetia bacterium]|nr:helix-turn-helix transcriptional regulator [Actinomycetes bacterium]
GLARTLDVVGDRWNLLIVRALLAEPLRFNDLASSVGPIATNLLSARVRELEAAGIVERHLGERGVLYRLTAWGEGLREPIEALARWGMPLMAAGRGDDAFQPRWLAVALPGLLRDVAATPAVELGIETEGFLVILHIDGNGPTAQIRPGYQPDAILTAEPETVVALAAGALTVDRALAEASFRGDMETLRAAFPAERATAASESARRMPDADDLDSP